MDYVTPMPIFGTSLLLNVNLVVQGMTLPQRRDVNHFKRFVNRENRYVLAIQCNILVIILIFVKMLEETIVCFQKI